MKIREATKNDILPITQLFYDTVNTINQKDYSKKQIAVWSESSRNIDYWLKCIQTQFFVVAEKDKLIIGFASLDNNACVDFMYVHTEYQNVGVATELLNVLESEAYKKAFVQIWSDVSITAKPFFLKKGFKEKEVYIKQLQDIEFENTIMIKSIQ
jgi:putative acetyltransferase